MGDRARVPGFALCLALALSATAAPGLPQASKARMDPRAVSAHPFAGQRGTTFVTTVRGNGLRGATSVFAPGAPLTAVIVGVETEPPAETGGRSRTPFDLVRLRVEVAGDARPGRYPFRLVTAQGITNSLVLYVTEHPVLSEPDGSHETAETAIVVTSAPAVFTGRLARRGETDYYAVQAKAGETFTFEAISGLEKIISGLQTKTQLIFPMHHDCLADALLVLWLLGNHADQSWVRLTLASSRGRHAMLSPRSRKWHVPPGDWNAMLRGTLGSSHNHRSKRSEHLEVLSRLHLVWNLAIMDDIV